MTGAFVLTVALASSASSYERDLRAVAALPGEPRAVSAAGVMKDETPILTIEDTAAFDPTSRALRLVLIGAPDDERSGAAVVDAVRWFKTRAPRGIKQQWTVSALPLGRFEPEDSKSLSRWVAFQSPDLIVTIGGQTAQPGVPSATVGLTGTIASLEKLLLATKVRSPWHEQMVARVRRDPLAIAGVLARRYPEAPSISYIPAVAWSNTLRLAAITNDGSLRAKVRDQTRPWTSGEKPLVGDRIQLTAVAGTLIFADLAAAGDSGAAALADRGASLAAEEKAPAAPQYGQGWTDDMFMTAVVLARSSGRPGHEHDLDTSARLLVEYASRLQRTDGLFNHASDGPAAWGRGNGFAALGLMEALTVMPERHPARAKLLDVFRRQMSAARTHQAPDGMWRQVIDVAGAYREETATAMLLTAMARGIRLGWIDRAYLPTVEHAWRALSAHIEEEGTVVDVCASTGAGRDRRYYLDRPAITGADDRGGAMALMAAVEKSVGR
jgi:unsaturated rhamnogalacturonyl hydrolase